MTLPGRGEGEEDEEKGNWKEKGLGFRRMELGGYRWRQRLLGSLMAERNGIVGWRRWKGVGV